MELGTDDDFNALKKASLIDLKKDIIKGVELIRNHEGRLVVKIKDFFSNEIEVLVGYRSAEHIENQNGLTKSLEDSAFIVLFNGLGEKLRFITNLYTEVRHIFNFPITDQQQRELEEIKNILVKKGLRI